MEATGKAHVEGNNWMHYTMPPAATYVCITNIRPVSGLMVRIFNKQIHDSSPSHDIKSIAVGVATNLDSAYKQISPITVAGAALDSPRMVYQLPDYPHPEKFLWERGT